MPACGEQANLSETTCLKKKTKTRNGPGTATWENLLKHTPGDLSIGPSDSQSTLHLAWGPWGLLGDGTTLASDFRSVSSSRGGAQEEGEAEVWVPSYRDTSGQLRSRLLPGPPRWGEMAISPPFPWPLKPRAVRMSAPRLVTSLPPAHASLKRPS